LLLGAKSAKFVSKLNEVRKVDHINIKI
jgi:hypothetical protein